MVGVLTGAKNKFFYASKEERPQTAGKPVRGAGPRAGKAKHAVLIIMTVSRRAPECVQSSDLDKTFERIPFRD